MMVYTPIAQGITTDEDSEFSFTDLLTTGDAAYSMENYATAETARKADTDPEGTFAVAVAAENVTTGARVVWVNCPKSDDNSSINASTSFLSKPIPPLKTLFCTSTGVNIHFSSYPIQINF